MSATFQQRQAELTKNLVDETTESFEITFAIARVNDSLEARGISYSDKEELYAVCEEVVLQLTPELNVDDLFEIIVNPNVMEPDFVASKLPEPEMA